MALQKAAMDQVMGQVESSFKTNEHSKSAFPITVSGFEYDRVLTLGKRVDKKSIDIQSLTQHFSVFPSDRGGLMTLHNQGQLVIYPHLPLRNLDIGVREYLSILCQTTEEFIQKYFQLSSQWNHHSPDGIFVGNQKVGFIGVRIEKGISKHGLALNICNNTSEYNLFTPCGHQSLLVGNLADLSPNAPKQALSDHFNKWCEIFKNKLT